MRLVFAGTPEPAVVALSRLLDSDHEVVAVITQPDARRGRGKKLSPSPVAALAEKRGIEVLKPATLKSDSEDGAAVRQRLAELAPDCIPVVAYGQLIPADMLESAPHGWVNLHFSVLPAWRGAAPVQSAILHGDDITGASTFRIEEGLDTGPVLGTLTQRIGPRDNADDLLTTLAYAGAELLVATMDGLESGAIEARAQQGEPSYAPKISTQDAKLDLSQPAIAVDRAIRAFTPAPGAWVLDAAEKRVKIGAARIAEESDAAPTLAPGAVELSKKAVFLGTGTTPLVVEKVQLPGKKMMEATAWARGVQAADAEGMQWR
ncbi:methionyl-tRNA formyltransferase [Corynebacterium sp. TAE3-ERU30]|uniref:methionyl-tRNA formyltransferase n=1 Tax=Corynebacterium sp. TAE3-ERU30 TaxID=2849496 RepID=UPI001C43954A|nr:methionyl-tRNA formyltransferase [Corynebacterium sp. TAE3-ERU30]MBV7280947.1 methionyl-tRNA formyltransferase [Corynebacterium sp. TAE3-ERU30]